MRFLLATLLLVGSTHTWAAPRSRGAQAAQLDELTISFSSGEGGVLQAAPGSAFVDLGTLSAGKSARAGAPKARRGAGFAIVERRSVRVTLQSPSSVARSATLRAFLQDGSARGRIRVDGILLSTAPQLIDRLAPVGVAVSHTIEVEVPASDPPGPLATAITWTAETN